MQVTTPDWPGNGNSSMPRKEQGNTLGCIKDDNAEVIAPSDDFLQLTRYDTGLAALLRDCFDVVRHRGGAYRTQHCECSN